LTYAINPKLTPLPSKAVTNIDYNTVQFDTNADETYSQLEPNTMPEQISVTYDERSLAWGGSIDISTISSVVARVESTLKEKGAKAISLYPDWGAEPDSKGNIKGFVWPTIKGKKYIVLVDYIAKKNRAIIGSIKERT